MCRLLKDPLNSNLRKSIFKKLIESEKFLEICHIETEKYSSIDINSNDGNTPSKTLSLNDSPDGMKSFNYYKLY
jgi:hypothetical protein